MIYKVHTESLAWNGSFAGEFSCLLLSIPAISFRKHFRKLHYGTGNWAELDLTLLWWVVPSTGLVLWLSDTAVMWLLFPDHLSNFLQVPACASPPTPRISGLVSLPQQCTGLIFSSLEKNLFLWFHFSAALIRLFLSFGFFFFLLWPRHSLVWAGITRRLKMQCIASF